MANKDLFAPPSEDELMLAPTQAELQDSNLFAPPTQEDISPNKSQTISEPEISKTESAIRGGVQGLTAGTADEITGFLEALGGKFKGNEEEFADLYRRYRDETRAKYAAAEKANPKTYLGSQLAGGIGQAAITGGTSLGALALQGAAQGLGSSEADLTKGDIAGAAKDTAIGGALGIGAGVVGKAIPTVTGKISDSMKKFAERAAENATGATGAQVSKFADDAGRQLLDRGLVKFGDKAENIALRVGKLKDKAWSDIDDALKVLDEKGITVSNKDLIKNIKSQIKELKKDPSQATLVEQLNKEVKNINKSGKAQAIAELEEKISQISDDPNLIEQLKEQIKNIKGVGKSKAQPSEKSILPELKKDMTEKDLFLVDKFGRKLVDVPASKSVSIPKLNVKVPISKAEEIKRGYQNKVNWITPDTNPLNANISDVYREAVEGAATKADPTLATKFLEGKKTYGLLAPIQEAAEKRAANVAQQQLGNLLDIGAGLYGISDPNSMTGKAALAIAGRRVILPRVASSAAVISDKLGKAIAKSPELINQIPKGIRDAAKIGAVKTATSEAVTDDSQKANYRVLNLDAKQVEPLIQKLQLDDSPNAKNIAEKLSRGINDPTKLSAMLFSIAQNKDQREKLAGIIEGNE